MEKTIVKIKTAASLNTVETKSFQPLEKGNYPVRILNYKDGISQAGNAKVDLELEVTSGQYAGRRLFGGITPGSAAALPFVRQALEAFGVSWDDEGFDPADLLGKSAVAIVDTEIRSDGTPGNKVKTFRKAA